MEALCASILDTISYVAIRDFLVQTADIGFEQPEFLALVNVSFYLATQCPPSNGEVAGSCVLGSALELLSVCTYALRCIAQKLIPSTLGV